MGAYAMNNPAPRVVVVGLASCFGCQLQITNAEAHLTDVLGQIDLRYWQLASSDPMPEDFDVAVIEGAVTTEESLATVRRLREAARVVIAVGACANLAGIPGMAAAGFDDRTAEVYADGAPSACGTMIAPRAVPDVIDVLQRAIYGSNRKDSTSTLCGECKLNDRGCFYGRGIMCLGLVTRAGCGARCVALDRPCNGCAGLSPNANLRTAHAVCEEAGIDAARFDKALEMFNQVNPARRIDADD